MASARAIHGHEPYGLTFGAESGIKESARRLARPAEGDGDVMVERTRMVVSFVAEKDFNEAAIKAVGSFMRRFKKQTRQDSVALVIDGEMYYL